MASKGVRLVIVVPALVASMAAVPPSSAHAGTGTETFVTMISEPGDYIGLGDHRFYHPANATISLSGTASYVRIRVNGGNLDDYFDFEFAPPQGQLLQVGEYDRAEAVRSWRPTRPGITIYGDGRGCGVPTTGRFRVNEITTDPSGDVTSVWIVYEHSCGGWGVLIGEVRVNVPGDGGNVAIGPREIRWRSTDPGSGMPVAPFVIRNTAATDIEIGSSSLSGPSAAELEVGPDKCAGKTLAPGAGCRVFVRWTPRSPGDMAATLLVPEVRGPIHALALEGYVHSGRTQLIMSSEEGDNVGINRTWIHTPSDSKIAAGANDRRVYGSVRFPEEGRWNGGYWSLVFEAPPGQTLTAGTTYENATNSTWNETGPGMEISGNGRACGALTGEFTINEIETNSYGELARLSVTFEQRCESGYGTLYGQLDFRTTIPAPEPWPETEIKFGPSGVVTTRDATFNFGSSVMDSTFECAFDASGFQPCTSPDSYTDLTEGTHVFRVRATSPAGKVDFSPAVRTWTVDAFGPVISFVRPTGGVYANDQSVGGSGPIVVIGSVTVQARATDHESGVATVGFDVNDTPVDASNVIRTGNWFRFTFRPPSAGQHTITARATNGSGVPSATTISVVGVPG